MLNFTCRDGVLFAEEAQTLFQHKLGKRKTTALLKKNVGSTQTDPRLI